MTRFFFFCVCVCVGGEGKCIMHPNTEALCVGLWLGMPVGLGHIPPCQPYPLKPPSAGEPGHIPLCEVHDQTFFVVEIC